MQMFVIVLLLGILLLAAGGAATFFGFAIKEFSFGNTLLSMGTTGVVGGLVIIGIAGAIRELRRIAAALNRQPSPLLGQAESSEAAAPGVRSSAPALRMPPPLPPMPPRSESPYAGVRSPGESRPARAPSAPEPLSLSAAEPPPVAPSSGGEPPPMVDEQEAIPLSPHVSQYSLPLEGEQSDAPATEHPPQPQDDAARAPGGDDELPHPKPVAFESGDPSRPAFGAIWPGREEPSQTADEISGSSGAPPFEEGAPSDQPVPAQPETAPADAEPAAEPPRPISILKSGVVDGMAYTLYSDGSIEAELPSGTIRFASISELRMHLERTD
jgi:hypothetical protein